MDKRLGALKLYRKHLLDQYSDRCGFWALRDISGEEMARTVTLTTDGADQETALIANSLSVLGCFNTPWQNPFLLLACSVSVALAMKDGF